MHKTFKSIFSLLLCVSLIGLNACSDSNEASLIIPEPYNAQMQSAIKLPQAPRFEKLLDDNGKINTELLEAVKATTIQKNYDNRVFIKKESQPYFYNPVYISYEQILNNQAIPLEQKNIVLEESFKKAKESGFKTVALFVEWKNFYNGTSYNFDYYKIYYKLAEKYDLNVSIVWNGYAKNGFMPWQNNSEVYPSLTVDGIPHIANVPDLSNNIYINEAVDAITQFCAWLNYIDYNRRTVLIQLEDEANTNYGKGPWLSQFENYSNLLLKMADAVKASPYRLVTTLGVSFDDYRTTIEGVTGRQRLDKFLLYDNIDGMGAANLISNFFNVGNFANDDKFCYISKVTPAINSFFETTMQYLSQGYQFGVYELKSFDLAVNCGLYRTHSSRWDIRTEQIVDRGILSKLRKFEPYTPDVVDYIKGINNMGSVLATANTLDVSVLNPSALNVFAMSTAVGDIKLSFNNFSNTYKYYNSAAVCAVDPYSNYYVTAFHQTPFLAIDCSYVIRISPGKIINGEWIADGDELILDNHHITLKSGVVYKFTLSDE